VAFLALCAIPTGNLGVAPLRLREGGVGHLPAKNGAGRTAPLPEHRAYHYLPRTLRFCAPRGLATLLRDALRHRQR